MGRKVCEVSGNMPFAWFYAPKLQINSSRCQGGVKQSFKVFHVKMEVLCNAVGVPTGSVAQRKVEDFPCCLTKRCKIENYGRIPQSAVFLSFTKKQGNTISFAQTFRGHEEAGESYTSIYFKWKHLHNSSTLHCFKYSSCLSMWLKRWCFKMSVLLLDSQQTAPNNMPFLNL